LSKLSILAALAGRGNWLLVSILLFATSLAFVAISVHIGRVLFGAPKISFKPFRPLQTSLMPGFLLCCSLIMGLVIYPAFWSFIK
jgi:hypothetical protein